MPTVYLQGAWKITMYYRDHEPPHFHIMTRDHREAQVRIDNLSVIVGDVPSRIVHEVVDWAAENRHVLRAKWRDLHPA